MTAVTNCHKMGGLRKSEIHFLLVLEATHPSSVSLGCNQCLSRTTPPLPALEERPFCASSSFQGLRRLLACGHIILIFVSMVPSFTCVCVSSLPLPLIRTPVAFRVQLDNFPMVRSLITSAKSVFLSNVTFADSSNWNLVSWGRLFCLPRGQG